MFRTRGLSGRRGWPRLLGGRGPSRRPSGRWFGRRADPDARLGLRLTLAAGAAFLVLIPFTLLLVLVETSFEPLHRFDKDVAASLHAYALDNPGWVTFLHLWTNVFGPETWRVLVVLAAVWLVHRRAPRLAAWAVTTIVVGGLLGLLLKVVVARARPHLPDPVALAPGASFPSGHALNATLGVGVLMLLFLPIMSRRVRAIAWAAGVVIVVGVAYTRVALGVHWVSDVTAGVVLGVAVVAATAAGFETWRRELGRLPSTPHLDGVEPEADEDISPTSPNPPKGSRYGGHRH
ncbi:phosphatase PAP2 family protein [Sphaerisporangium sp. TRM90804]|uniref:phosphatase PAP2 family protein n=1 Tax=Sphaerisporangium sp. TRM90804 TaxID=3031113 RepID=UPI002447616A|nr:phosphatase PAP2 family protein [Sphaerisporangium sp. TRM90804]MDH2428051.1 phosphatase PAP2 family protein [Sphaerisporangium sp. TRM90804]